MSDPREEAIEAAQKSGLVDATLMKHRVISLFGEIDQHSARSTVGKLLALAAENSEPITLYLSSPGGHVESGDTIYDVIQFIEPEVRIVGTGWVGSAAFLVYLAAQRKNRYALTNTRFLIHQPAGGFGGTASDIEIHAREIIKMRSRVNQLIAEGTGQKLEKIEQDTERDFWLTAEEAKDYGAVGKIIASPKEMS